MATTPNHGWTTPNDSDPFKDGALAIRTLGNGVDTTLKTALGGNYAGLRLIKTQTVGTAVSSVQVTSAFSATYDNYKIIYTGGSAAGGADFRLTVGSAVTNYYGALIYNRPNNNLVLGVSINNGTYWQYGGGLLSANGVHSSFDLYAPFLTARTSVQTQVMDLQGAGSAFGTFTGFHDAATSHTSFTLTPSAGTVTGGTIYVYGYGKN